MRIAFIFNLWILLTVIVPTSSLSADDPTREEFAKALIVELAAVTNKKFELDAEEFKLFESKDKANEINLTNVYDEHLGLEQVDRPEHLKRIARVFGAPSVGIPSDFEKARENLRPKVWTRAMLEMSNLTQKLRGSPGLELPTQPLGDHLLLTLVFDTPDAMRSVSNQQLKEWKVTKEKAFEVARKNLRETTGSFARIGDHLHISTTGDAYDSSRIVLVAVEKFKVNGERIALIPNRNGLFITGSKDETLMQAMFDLAKPQENVRPLSPLPLVLKDNKWVDWIPADDHPFRAIYEERKRGFLGQLYKEQQDVLDKLHEKKELDLFVSSFSAARNPETNITRSYCVWSKGVDSLLPQTELVILCTKPGEIAAVGKWDHVRKLVGDLIEEDNSYYPPRFRVKKFPREELLKAIGKIEF